MSRYRVLLILLALLGANADVQASVKQPIAYLAWVQGYWQVWVMDSNGKTQKQITTTSYDKYCISWFPDGKHLLVNSFQGKLEIVNVETMHTQEIQLPLQDAIDAVISPDGKQIAFAVSTTQALDGHDIWASNIDGSNLKKMTNMPYLQHEPTWGQGGKWLYFLSGRGKQAHDIWRVNLKNRNTEQLTVGQLYHFELAIASDGQLAFSSNRGGNYDIWRMQPGGKAEKLTDNKQLDGQPTWSPDNKEILFESNHAGVPNIWTIRVEDKQKKQLTAYERGARMPVWYRKPGVEN